ncbi:MAG: hypothetical protein K2L67_05590 [Clostridia bacterium]|nr:hypothetical protein [Clostridia bacterium]
MKDKEMTFEEKLNVMEKLGIQKEWAKWELKLESDVWAVLPCFRFLKPISDHLEFHRGGFANMIKKYSEQGVLNEKFPEVAALIKEGASIESIEKFAYERISEAVECILYQLGDQESAECADVFDEIDFSEMNKLRLMEVKPDGTPTGRYAIELHGKIPFSDMED